MTLDFARVSSVTSSASTPQLGVIGCVREESSSVQVVNSKQGVKISFSSPHTRVKMTRYFVSEKNPDPAELCFLNDSLIDWLIDKSTLVVI